MSKRWAWSALVTLSAIIASIPLFSDSLILGNDALFHLARIEGIKDGLLSGQFPVKIYGYFFYDYGYPAGYFYPDLFLYFPALLRLLGASPHFSYHFFCFFVTIATIFIAWYSFTKLFSYLREETDAPAYVLGAIASVCYTCALYRLVDVYTRSAVGEVLAICFLPLAVTQFYLLLKSKDRAWIGAVIGITGVLQSHVLSSFLLFLALVIISIVSWRSFLLRNVLKSLLLLAVFVLLLNLWFYVPFFGMYDSYNFQIKGAVSAADNLLVFPWDTILHYRGFMGFLPLIFTVAIIGYKILKKENFTRLDRIGVLFAALWLATVFMMSDTAPWGVISHIPLVGEILGVLQFAVRLMTLGIMAYAISAAILLRRFSTLKIAIISMLIMCESLFSIMSADSKPENDWMTLCYEDKMVLGDLKHELRDSPLGSVPLKLLHAEKNPMINIYRDYLHSDIKDSELLLLLDQRKAEYWQAVAEGRISPLDPYAVKTTATVEDFSRKSVSLFLTVTANSPATITLPLWYYPKVYRGEADGEPLNLFETARHRLAVNVPAGKHHITIYAKERAPYRHALYISIFGFILFAWIARREYLKSVSR